MFFFFLVILGLNGFACVHKSSRKPASTSLATGGDLVFTSGEENLSFQGEPNITGNPDLVEPYPPRGAAFTKSLTHSRNLTNENFLNFSLIQKANHIHDIASIIIETHNFDYSPRIITCKIYKESTFNPQIEAKHTSAKGISQVTDGTVGAVFSQKTRIGFEFKTPGFQNIKEKSEFIKRMAGSMNAQIELGIAVLKLKSVESGSLRIKTLLRRYYGHKKQICNKDYANRIFDCALCIKRLKGISKKCLKKAGGAKNGCG